MSRMTCAKMMTRLAGKAATAMVGVTTTMTMPPLLQAAHPVRRLADAIKGATGGAQAVLVQRLQELAAAEAA